jgi:hypothetical protein
MLGFIESICSSLNAEIEGAAPLAAKFSRLAVGFICQHGQPIAYRTVLERVGELAITLSVLPKISRIVHWYTPYICMLSLCRP